MAPLLAPALALALAAAEGPAAGSRAEAATRFLQVYYNGGDPPELKFLGAPSRQSPNDNWAMLELLSELKPMTVIEAGTAEGGTALFYSAILDLVRPGARVLTVDVEDMGGAWRRHRLWRERVVFHRGDSVGPQTLRRFARESRPPVLVTLDSLHRREHVLREMELYSRLVSAGSYLVVQDTNLNGHPVYPGHGPGPWEAVEDFLRCHPEFERDRSRERFQVTFYPGGWLKKVREGPRWGPSPEEIDRNCARAEELDRLFRPAAASGLIPPSIRKELARELGGGPEIARYYAAMMLASAPGSEGALIGALKDPSLTVRRAAIESLEALRPASAMASLLPLIDDRALGPTAARAASAISAAGAAGALKKVLLDRGRDTHWRCAAAEALGSAGKEALPALLEVLGDPGEPEAVRAAAAAALGRLGDPSAAAPLAACLGSGQDLLGWHCAQALGRLGARGEEKALLAALRDGRLHAARMGAADALGRLGARAARETLARLFQDRALPGDLRRSALAAAHRIDPRGAAPLIEQALKDPEFQVRFEAKELRSRN